MDLKWSSYGWGAAKGHVVVEKKRKCTSLERDKDSVLKLRVLHLIIWIRSGVDFVWEQQIWTSDYLRLNLLLNILLGRGREGT